MKERPILFSGPMVRAILDRRKTQTRRIVRMPEGMHDIDLTRVQPGFPDGSTRPVWGTPDEPNAFSTRCPYGEPGDRLWVRETWYCDHCFVGDFATTRTSYIGKTLTDAECIAEWRGKPIPQDLTEEGHMMYYRADGELSEQMEQCESPNCWKPSIHMPRWASRITLEVTAVHVERLTEISANDVVREGLKLDDHLIPGVHYDIDQEWWPAGERKAREVFAALWDSINGERASWASNPWVWVVEFKRAIESAAERAA